jgi:hypothetical protein
MAIAGNRIDTAVIHMPKRKPDQVITHRIEMGAWEREHIGKPVSTTLGIARIVSSGALVVGAGGIALAAYGLYYFFDKVYGAFENLGKLNEEIFGPIFNLVGPTPLTDEEKKKWEEGKNESYADKWEKAVNPEGETFWEKEWRLFMLNPDNWYWNQEEEIEYGPDKPQGAPPTGTYDEYGIWGGQVGPPDNRP